MAPAASVKVGEMSSKSRLIKMCIYMLCIQKQREGGHTGVGVRRERERERITGEACR